MLVALPALHLIARAFPDAERRMLTNVPVHAKAPAAAAVLEGTGLVDGYFRYPVGTRAPLTLLRLLRDLRRWRPEVVVYLTAARGVAVARRDQRFFRACGARRVVGVPLLEAMQGNFFGEDPQSPAAKERLFAGELEPEAHRLTRNLGELGEGQVEELANWSLHLGTAEHERAMAAIGAVALGSKPLAVSVGTKVQSKDWGRGNWRALLDRLAPTVPGRALLLLGAPEEAEVSAFAAENWQRNGGGTVVNLCGQLSPRESAAAIAQSAMFLGHDSGPMHLAASVGTPVVAIFAARNIPRQWFPAGDRNRVLYRRVECWGCGLETCIEQQKKCLAGITVDEVLSAARALLADEEQLLLSRG